MAVTSDEVLDATPRIQAYRPKATAARAEPVALLGSTLVRAPIRTLVSVAVLAAVLAPRVPAAAGETGPCPLEQRDGETVRQLSKRFIRCAADRWAVPGGADKAICIARVESDLDPEAVSAGGDYLGLFQHSADAWPDRYEQWTRESWGLDESALSGRTDAIVTIRMVNANGWGPWSGVDDC